MVDARHGLAHGFQMGRWSINAVGVGLLEDVLICCSRNAGRRIDRNNVASPDVLCLGCRDLKVMNTPVHPIDGKPHAFAQLIAAQCFGDDAPDDPLGG